MFIFHFEIFRKILFLYEVTNCDIYVSKNKERIGHIIRFIFKILHINNNTIKKLGKKLINKSKKIDYDYIWLISSFYAYLL